MDGPLASCMYDGPLLRVWALIVSWCESLIWQRRIFLSISCLYLHFIHYPCLAYYFFPLKPIYFQIIFNTIDSYYSVLTFSIDVVSTLCLHRNDVESSSTSREGKLFHVLIVLAAKENLNEEVLEPRTWNLCLCLALVRPSTGVKPLEVASTPTCPWTTLNINANRRSLQRSFSSCSPKVL